MTWCGLKIIENYHVFVNKFHGNLRSKTLSFREIKSVFRDVKWCFKASWGFKGLRPRFNHIWRVFRPVSILHQEENNVCATKISSKFAMSSGLSVNNTVDIILQIRNHVSSQPRSILAVQKTSDEFWSYKPTFFRSVRQDWF